MSKEVPASASVVVIGGGVIGTSIAFHLAQAGVTDVVLIERDELAAGSTSKAAGGIRGSFSHPANIEIGLRGLEQYARFDRDHAQDIDFSRIGYLCTLSSQESWDLFTESTALQNRYGVPSRMISSEEAVELSPLLNPEGLVGAAWSPEDAKATPESVISGYARSARGLGVSIVTQCAVIGIDVEAGAISVVRTTLGTIATRHVVCAAGAWSRAIGEMVGIEIPVDPVRRQIAITEPLPKSYLNAPLTIDFPSNFYFHPEGSGQLLGWSDPSQAVGFNLKFELEGWLEGLGEIAAVRAPAVLDAGIVTGWAGLYEVTPDRNQIIDRSDAVDGLIIATGYSGHGFLMGPATGEIVRDLYLDREPAYDISDFTLARFERSASAPAEFNIF